MPIERWIPYRHRGGVNTSDEAGAGSPNGIDADANDNLSTGAAETTGAHSGGINTMFLDGSVRTSGPQVSLVLTFQGDRIEPSGSSEIDAQGRLLVGTDGGIWRGAGEALLIGGRTTLDFDSDGNDFLLWRESDTNAQTFDYQSRGGVTVAVGDMEASKISAGTQLASVTDLIIDPFNNNADADRFVYLYYTTTTPNLDVDGGSLSTMDKGIPATMAEYALFA